MTGNGNGNGFKIPPWLSRFVPAIVAGFIAAATSYVAVREEMTAQGVRIEYLYAEVLSLRDNQTAATRDRYTGEQASRDRSVFVDGIHANRKSLERIDARLDDLSDRLSRIEGGAR